MSNEKQKLEPEFWKRKSLDDMSAAEWEAVCDGCGRCCLHKLEDVDTGQLVHTRVACHLLDIQACRCSNYERRLELVPDCMGSLASKA